MVKKGAKLKWRFLYLDTLQAGSGICHSFVQEVKSSAFSLVSPLSRIKSSMVAKEWVNLHCNGFVEQRPLG